jgi:NADH-quinone oxidoreductase subunit M
VFFGPLKEPHGHDSHGHGQHEEIKDMNLREFAALAPLCVFVLWIGIQPQFFLDRMAPQLDAISDRAEAALTKRETIESPAATTAQSPVGVAPNPES